MEAFPLSTLEDGAPSVSQVFVSSAHIQLRPRPSGHQDWNTNSSVDTGKMEPDPPKKLKTPPCSSTESVTSLAEVLELGQGSGGSASRGSRGTADGLGKRDSRDPTGGIANVSANSEADMDPATPLMDSDPAQKLGERQETPAAGTDLGTVRFKEDHVVEYVNNEDSAFQSGKVAFQAPDRDGGGMSDEEALRIFQNSRRSTKRWSAVEDFEMQQGFGSTLKRMLGCASNMDGMYDDPMPVAVFGATGMVGGHMVRALVKDGRFEVRAVTRTPTTDYARKLAEEGAIISSADLNDPRSLTRVLDGCYAVFLVTTYWEHMSVEKEFTQGKHCVDAAVWADVGHFIFWGAEDPHEVCGVTCNFMASKAAIEQHIRDSSLPYTILRVPFYYDNFLGVFKPHRISDNLFAIALPMDDHTLEMISLRDVAKCVVQLLLKPKDFIGKVVSLGVEKLTVQQIVDVFNKHFTDRKFTNPQIQLKDYEAFDFQGASDVAGMFRYLQHGGQDAPDLKLRRKLQGTTTTFDRWVLTHVESLTDIMESSW